MRHLAIVAIAFLGAYAACYALGASWNDYRIVGKRFELVDAERIQSYRFGRDGLVAAVLGTKNGPVAAPLLYWPIDGERLLISRARGGEPNEVLTLITISAPEISAQNISGQIVRYRVAEVP
jgi:hypothetical protein